MSEKRSNFTVIDPIYFKKLTGEPYWFLGDALFYLYGFAPVKNPDEKRQFFLSNEGIKRLVDYIYAAIDMKELEVHNYDPLVYFHQTDEQTEQEMLDSLITAKVKPKEFVDWVSGLPMDIPILVEQKNNSADLSEKERTSLLKMIIAMAIDGYGHDPKANKSPTTGDIANAIRLHGLSLNEDTIRRYLKESATLLPSDWDKDS